MVRVMVVFVSLFLFAFNLGYAEVIDAGSIFVTAGRFYESIYNVPYSVEVITEEDISSSNAKNLAQLLAEKLPGHIHMYPGALTSIGIRGFRTDTHGTDIKGRVLILIDGNRAGTGNLAAIPLEGIKRIEILKGPASVIYGSAAMGGVVNIITKRGRGKNRAKLSYEIGDWNYSGEKVSASGSYEDLGYFVSFEKYERDDYMSADGNVIDNTQFNGWAGFARLDVGKFSVVSQFTEYWHVGNPGSLWSPDPDNYKDIRRKYFSVSYGNLKSRNGVYLSVYYVDHVDEWHDPSMSWGYFRTVTDAETKGIRFNLSKTFSESLRLVGGLDYDKINVENSKDPAGAPFSPNTEYTNLGPFIYAETSWDRFIFTAGLRLDYFEEKIKSTPGLVVVPDTEYYSHLTWKGGLVYKITDRFKFRLNAGEGFRTPAADELAGRYIGAWSKYVGNPDLKPEKNVTYGAGFDYKKHSFVLTVSYFYTIYEDKIADISTCISGDCSWKTYTNVEGARIAGLELSLGYDFGELLESEWIIKPYINMVKYTERKIEDDKYSSDIGTDQIPYISDINVTGGLELGTYEKAVLSVLWFYQGKQKVIDWNWTSPTYKKAISKSGFGVVNAKFTVFISDNFKFNVGVDNVFNKYYEFVNGYPMPARTIKIGAEVVF